jgi:hypothetical protein
MNGVRYAIGADTMNLWFDVPTGLLAVSEILTEDGVLGDRRTLTWYTRWQDAGGVQLPRQVDTEVNGRILSHNIVAAHNQQVSTSQFAFPIRWRAGPTRAPPPSPSPWPSWHPVWRAEEGTHHSLVLERGRPAGGRGAARRGQRGARYAAPPFPGKRVTAVVATHHHWDHSAGSAPMAGIPVADPRNRVRAGVGAAGNGAPDAIARGAAAPRPDNRNPRPGPGR